MISGKALRLSTAAKEALPPRDQARRKASRWSALMRSYRGGRQPCGAPGNRVLARLTNRAGLRRSRSGTIWLALTVHESVGTLICIRSVSENALRWYALVSSACSTIQLVQHALGETLAPLDYAVEGHGQLFVEL